MEDVAAHTGRAGEDQVIERQFRERLADIGTARHEGEFVDREISARDLLEQGSHARREFRCLDHRPVARREHAGERRHDEVHRKIPGRDHADHALGLELDPGLRAEQSEREQDRALLSPRPFLDRLDRVIDRRDRTGNVGEHRLLAAAMAEILAQGIAEFFGIVGDHRRRAFEPILADGDRDGKIGHERSTLPRQDFLHRRHSLSPLPVVFRRSRSTPPPAAPHYPVLRDRSAASPAAPRRRPSDHCAS